MSAIQSNLSKTAKSSMVQDKKEKKVLTDDELIRLLRIDVDSGLYPSSQGSQALLRSYDALFERLEACEEAARQSLLDAKDETFEREIASND